MHRVHLPVADRIDAHVTAVLHAEQRRAIKRREDSKVGPCRLEVLAGPVKRQVDRKQKIRHMLLAHVQRDLLLVRFSGRPHGIAVIQLDGRHLLLSPKSAGQKFANFRRKG
jgi:hypothetical protein